MIFYTIVPLDSIMEGFEQEPQYQEVTIGGKTIIFEQMELTKGRIVRIISTDPKDFLDISLQPGMTINFSPEFT